MIKGMNYEYLFLKTEYIGKSIHYKGRKYRLKVNMPSHQKRFLYNMGFKYVFKYIQPKSKLEKSNNINNEIITDNNFNEWTLFKLREQFPNIKARSKDDFIEKINLLKDKDNDNIHKEK